MHAPHNAHKEFVVSVQGLSLTCLVDLVERKIYHYSGLLMGWVGGQKN